MSLCIHLGSHPNDCHKPHVFLSSSLKSRAMTGRLILKQQAGCQSRICFHFWFLLLSGLQEFTIWSPGCNFGLRCEIPSSVWGWDVKAANGLQRAAVRFRGGTGAEQSATALAHTLMRLAIGSRTLLSWWAASAGKQKKGPGWRVSATRLQRVLQLQTVARMLRGLEIDTGSGNCLPRGRKLQYAAQHLHG